MSLILVCDREPFALSVVLGIVPSLNLLARDVALSLGVSSRTISRILASDAMATMRSNSPPALWRSRVVALICEALALRQRPPYATHPRAKQDACQPAADASGVSARSRSECPPPGGGVEQVREGLGPIPTQDSESTPKRVYLFDIKEKRGKGPRKVVRLRGPWGPKGGRRRGSKELHPVVEDMIWEAEK